MLGKDRILTKEQIEQAKCFDDIVKEGDKVYAHICETDTNANIVPVLNILRRHRGDNLKVTTRVIVCAYVELCGEYSKDYGFTKEMLMEIAKVNDNRENWRKGLMISLDCEGSDGYTITLDGDLNITEKIEAEVG